MEKCNYCPNEKDLAIDMIYKGFVCDKCLEHLEKELDKCGGDRNKFHKVIDAAKLKEKQRMNKKSFLSELSGYDTEKKEKDIKQNSVIALNRADKLNKYSPIQECKKCKTVGLLESEGGSMIPINEEVQEEVMYDDEWRLNVPFGVRFSTWDFTLCKGCLKTILNKRKKKLDI